MSRNRHLTIRKKTIIIGLSALAALVLLFAALVVTYVYTPWPKAFLARYEFKKNGIVVGRALAKYAPQTVTEIKDQQYRANDKDAFLDVYYPNGTTTQLPTIIWTHGGAWIGGDKNEMTSYAKILAAQGYTVIAPNYSLAPEKTYPTPIIQINTALGYLQNNAHRLHIDTSRLILAGDSAGSQITAQVANIIANPQYAQAMNIQPTVSNKQIRGTILACGAYNIKLIKYNANETSQFVGTLLWAYAGEKDFATNSKFQYASVDNYLTNQFPPSFITVGNDDGLEPQSKQLAERLADKGVETDTLFFAASHQPKLPHEYQFNLDSTDGQLALQRIQQFLTTHTQTRQNGQSD